MMDATRWARAQEIFHELADRPADVRAAELEALCGDDAELRSDVLAMLRADTRDEPFLDPPTPDDVDRALRHDAGEVRPRTRLGPWSIGDEIASGGMGTVFRAERVDGAFEQTVAIKVIRAGFDSQDLLRRFQNERRTLARLQHENIARLVDGGATSEGIPWLAMELVDGCPLDVHCREEGLAVAERIDLFRSVLDAVAYAHRNLVVHRDLKPTNILVTDDGVPKLLDFGIAKLLDPEDATDGSTADSTAGSVNEAAAARTQTQARVMTPEYASPEQVRGEPITTASDVYSLGVVLYELLTDQRPYRRATTRTALERAICDESPPAPSTVRPLDRDLDTIVFAAMHKEPSRRYPSVDALAEDLRRLRSDLPVLARRDSIPYRVKKFVRRNTLGAAMILVAATAVLGGAAFSTNWAIRAEAEKERADAVATRLAHESNRLRDVNLFLEEVLSSPDPRQSGRDVRVLDALEQAREKLECRLGGDPEVEVRIRMTLGRTYFGLGFLAEARVEQEAAVRQVDDALDDPVLRARARHQLAQTLNRIGKRDEAKALFEDALEVLGDADQAARAGVLSMLGSLLVARGDRDDGFAHLRAALDITRTLSSPHSEHANALVRLARQLQFAAGDVAAAEAALDEAIPLYEALLPDDHPTLVEARSLIAVCAHESGRSEEARDLLVPLIERLRARLGATHPDLLHPLSTLAQALLALDDVERAREVSREALAVAESNFDEDHPALAPSLSNLAMVLRRLGDDDGCERAYVRALDVQLRAQGADHPDTAILRSNYAVFLIFAERYDEAEPQLKLALETHLRTRGEGNVHAAETLNSIAFLHRRKGDHAAALPWFRRSLAAWRLALPADHPRLTNIFYLTASCEFSNDEPDRAAPLLEECVALQAKVSNTPPVQRAAAQELLAACYSDLGRFDEAEALFEESVPVLVEAFGEEDKRVATARRRWSELETARADAGARED